VSRYGHPDHLEGLAEPGGIYISGKVHDETNRKLDLSFEDLGEQNLKNIARPVRVYRVRGDTQLHQLDHAPAPVKLTVAVLPFENMSGDPEQRYFSDGITEDILTELSHFRQLFVVARNSTFKYRDRAVDIRSVARELGAQYVVEGSVRKAGNRARVTVQLIEGATGNHVWAERLDRDLQDIFAVQAELAQAIAARVSGQVERGERKRLVTLNADNLRAYDHFLRGRELLARHIRADNDRARLDLEAAVRLDPGMAEAYAELGQVYVIQYFAWWTADRAAALARAFELAKRAVALDERSSRCRWTLGLIHLFRGEYDEARLHFETGIDLNPNDTRARAIYGLYLMAVGRSDEAIQQYDIAAALDPRDESWIPWLRGSALFVAHRYEEAIDALKPIVDPINEKRGWLAASLAQAGRSAEAAAALEEFLRVAEEDMTVFPGRRVRDWERYWQDTTAFQHRSDLDHLLEGLHKAGLPE
jgi:adenylate cyclase